MIDRGVSQGRHHGRGRGRNGDHRQPNNEFRSHKSHMEGHSCKKNCHVKVECRFKDKGINVAEEKEDSNLFMAFNEVDNIASSIWLVDSGCSNHITSMRSLLNEHDETHKLKVTLGDNKKRQVEGKGSVGIKMTNSKMKLIHGV